MTHYIHDELNNRIEGMSKEEIYALLAAAIQSGQLPSVDEDTAFVTMFKSIVDGKTYKMAFCTQAQYNQLEAQGLLVADAYYIITDDTTYDDLLDTINNILDGTTPVEAAINANKVQMVSNNADEGKKYLLHTPQNMTSGGNNTPQYNPFIYIVGDNNGLHVDDQSTYSDDFIINGGTSADISVLSALTNIKTKKLVLHNLTIDRSGYNDHITFTVFNNSDADLTWDDLLSSLVDSNAKLYVNNGNVINADGIFHIEYLMRGASTQFGYNIRFYYKKSYTDLSYIEIGSRTLGDVKQVLLDLTNIF